MVASKRLTSPGRPLILGQAIVQGVWMARWQSIRDQAHDRNDLLHDITAGGLGPERRARMSIWNWISDRPTCSSPSRFEGELSCLKYSAVNSAMAPGEDA
jgi:hypothetical protein